MTFRCPYTEQCRAKAILNFAEAPELAAVFQSRLQCSVRDPEKAARCAAQLGLTEARLSAFGSYVQEQRRARQLPQAQVAHDVGIDVQELRDIELNKVAPQQLTQHIIDRIAQAIAAPAEYLRTLARAAQATPSLRTGAAFARTAPPPDHQEPHG